MNLYQISTNLQNIMYAVEENEGELTPELEEALSINEEAFKDKIDDYVKVIRQTQTEIEACKVEEKRVKSVRESKEKLLEKLQTVVAKAVSEFGDTTKTGGKFVSYPTYKVSVRHSETCEIDEDVVNYLGENFGLFIQGLVNNGMIGKGNDFREDLVKKINEHSNVEVDKSILENLNFEIKFKGTIDDLFNVANEGLLKALTEERNGVITYNASKFTCKKALQNGEFIPFANIVEKDSITIK